MENENLSDINDGNQHPPQMDLEITFDATVFDRDTETPSLSSHSNSNKLVNCLDEHRNTTLMLSKSSPSNCEPTSPVPVDFLTVPIVELESESESDSNTETEPDPSHINQLENQNQTEKLTRIQTTNKLEQNQPQFIQNYQLPSYHNCSYCSKTFGTKHILKNHLRTHLNNFDATIPPEPKSIHKSIHTSKSKSIVFKNATKKKSSSLSSFTNPVEFRCRATICEQIFFSRLKWEHHERSHMKDNQTVWKCTLCPQTYDCKNRYLLKIHMVQHLHVTSFKCDKCNLYFKSEKVFSDHLLVHDRVEVEEKVSEEEFEEEEETMEKPPKVFKCDVCSLSFKNYAILRNHIGKRIYENHRCYFCPEVFCTNTAKATHIKLNHPVEETKKLPEQEPEPVPESEFKTVVLPPVKLSSLMGEDSGIVLTSDPVVCAMCNKTYGNIQALSLHQRVDHLVKPLKINVRQLHTEPKIQPESRLNEEAESNLDLTPEEELSKAAVAQILEENKNHTSNVDGEANVKVEVEDIEVEPDIHLFM